MRKIACILLCVLATTGSCDLYAQNIQKKAQKYVTDLASPEFHGRGYTFKGDSLAANYIKEKFEQFGLQAGAKSSYYQPFAIPVNTYPYKIVLAIGDDTLKIGDDYIPDPNGGYYTGSFMQVWIDSTNVKSLGEVLSKYKEAVLSNKVVFVVDDGGIDNRDKLIDFQSARYGLANYAPVIYINDKKLTWSMSQDRFKFPIFEVKSSVFSKDDEVYMDINGVYHEKYATQNVIATVPAKKKCKRKKHLFITAHYDHLGTLGTEAYIPGANDNASGIAMLLSLAEHYAANPLKDYNLTFIAFSAEEVGLMGSKFYTENPTVPLDKIEFLLNLDLQGTGNEGITVVNATLHEKKFLELAKINVENDLLVKIKKRGEAANSDHYYFTRKGVPAFFVYTMGGIQAYHDIYDKAETLPLTEFEDLFTLYTKFLESF